MLQEGCVVVAVLVLIVLSNQNLVCNFVVIDWKHVRGRNYLLSGALVPEIIKLSVNRGSY